VHREEKTQWVWTATGQSVNYVNWASGEPEFDEGEGHAIKLGTATHKMVVSRTSLNRTYRLSHYICEKSTSVNRLENSPLEKKSCSAGSGWTCRIDNSAHCVTMRFWDDRSPDWVVHLVTKEFFPLCEKYQLGQISYTNGNFISFHLIPLEL
jgi:hypothetical protein